MDTLQRNEVEAKFKLVLLLINKSSRMAESAGLAPDMTNLNEAVD